MLAAPSRIRQAATSLSKASSIVVRLSLPKTDVGPTNNVSERALHPAVIHRKVNGSFRSEWGVQAYAALALVIDIVILTGINTIEALQHLSGKPSLLLSSSVWVDTKIALGAAG